MRNSIELCSGIALALCACGAAQETITETTSTAAAAEPPAAVADGVPPAAPAPAPPAGIAPAPALDFAGSASTIPPTIRLSDGEIGEVLDTVDDAQIAAGELVLARSHNEAVKELAADLVKEHKKANQDIGALMLRLNTPPRDSDLSRALSDKADATLARLEALDDTALDRAYLDSQVTLHQEMLVAVDRTLVPNAQNQDLEVYVASLRPMLSAHLHQATSLNVVLAAR
jgi:putative membrane protein